MRSFVVGLAVLSAIVASVIGCAPRPQPPAAAVAPGPPSEPPATEPEPAAAADLGKSIFTTGIGASGSVVSFEKGSDKFRANPAGCARCHGDDGRGKKSKSGHATPAITYASLREPHGGEPADFASDDELKSAVIKGLEPGGERLSPNMPRWHLTDAEFAALLDHLKAL